MLKERKQKRKHTQKVSSKRGIKKSAVFREGSTYTPKSVEKRTVSRSFSKQRSGKIFSRQQTRLSDKPILDSGVVKRSTYKHTNYNINPKKAAIGVGAAAVGIGGYKAHKHFQNRKKQDRPGGKDASSKAGFYYRTRNNKKQRVKKGRRKKR